MNRLKDSRKRESIDTLLVQTHRGSCSHSDEGWFVNVVGLWNTIYMDAVLTQLRKEGYPVLDEDAIRLSPFGHEHINMLGRYSFAVHDSVARGELRPLRTPSENP